jgi:ribosomal-protein-alanine N-acetyltransferase
MEAPQIIKEQTNIQEKIENKENKVSIRLAIGKDCKAIHKCNKASLPVVYEPTDIIKKILSPVYDIIVAEKDGEIIGYIITQIIKINEEVYKCHILSIAVLEEHRRKGIATTLVNNAFDYCYELYYYQYQMNVNKITLYVEMTNNIARKFYRKMDFTKGEKMHHYYGKGEHGLMMYKNKPSHDDIKKMNDVKEALKELV